MKTRCSISKTTTMALAAGLGLSMSQPAHAGIVANTGLNIEIDITYPYEIDFDSNAIPEFTIYTDKYTYNYSGHHLSFTAIGLSGNDPDKVAGSGIPFYDYYIPTAFALPSGVQIDEISSGWISADYKWQNPISGSDYYSVGMAAGISYPLPYGQLKIVAGPWVGADHKFLGLQFELDNSTHYGWAELSVVYLNEEFTATLYGYAYNDEAEGPIKSGQVPIPSSLLLLGSGAGAVAAFRRRQKKAR